VFNNYKMTVGLLLAIVELVTFSLLVIIYAFVLVHVRKGSKYSTVTWLVLMGLIGNFFGLGIAWSDYKLFALNDG